MIKKVLNTTEAMEYLGIGRRVFEAAVKQGDISFKAINNKKYFPVWVLDKWLNSTVNLIDYTKEAKSITPTFRSSAKDSEYSLEKLAEQLLSKKPSTTACKGLSAYNKKQKTKPMVDCLA